MIEKIEELLVEVNAFQSQNKDEIEQFRIKFNSKKGILNDLFDKFKEVPNEQKRDFGQKSTP
jgi:phenylalanyl-tRNA synthetase alpha chain